MPELSFITINYNGLSYTTALLRSLQSVVTSVAWEVIVVDNGSTADEAGELRRLFSDDERVNVVEAGANLGFAAGNNLGIRSAKADALMLINNDTFVEEDHFRQLLNRLEDSSIGAVCPKLRFADGERLIQYAGFTDLSAVTLRNSGIGCCEHDRGQYDTACPTAFAHGAALLFTRRTLALAGWMTEQYFLYYEEMDWSMLIRRAHLQIWYDPVQTVFHRESQTTGQNSPLRTFYMTRNRLLFAHRNRNGLTRLLCYAYLMAVYLLRDIPVHLLHLRPALAWATLRGIFAFFIRKPH